MGLDIALAQFPAKFVTYYCLVEMMLPGVTAATDLLTAASFSAVPWQLAMQSMSPSAGIRRKLGYWAMALFKSPDS